MSTPGGAGAPMGQGAGWWTRNHTITAAVAGAVITGIFTVAAATIRPDSVRPIPPSPVFTTVPGTPNSRGGPVPEDSATASTDGGVTVPSGYEGLWQGVLVPQNGSSQTPVNMTLHGGQLGTVIGITDYPAVSNCTENLILISLEGGLLVVEERPQSGSDWNCGPAAVVMNLSGTKISAKWYDGPSSVGAGAPYATMTLQKVLSFS